MTFNKVHLLFEQSGTFKNEFVNLGFLAYDYDIENQFKKTDFILDLYKEINEAYNNNSSIFDSFSTNDLIIAFFPCIRFEDQILLCFKGINKGYEKWSLEDKLINDLILQSELTNNYNIITKLVLVCLRKGFKLIIENPYSSQHYLITHWCLKPNIIDYDRHARGDYFVKPTAYWFINCEPSNNLILETPDYKLLKTVDSCSIGIERSLISPDYANRFIREFVL